MPGLRIGVNALYLIPGRVGGTEIYLRSLLGALAEIDSESQYVVFTNRETGQDLVPSRDNFLYAPQPVRASFRPARIVWEQTGLAVAAMRHRLDVLFNPGFTSPILCPCPTVTVFHDLQHKRHPEYFRWFDLPFWRFLLYASAHRSALLLAVSEATHVDLLHFYRLRDEDTRVVPLGVDENFFEIGRLRRGTEPSPYLLTVSTLHPHKNLDRLIRAFARFREMQPDFQLVIAGLHGFHTQEVEKQIRSLSLESSVRITGWLPRKELYDLFLRAFAFIYPSTFEGFGLPLPEALAAGVPTACSSIEPMKGIAATSALLFDPNDEGAIYDAMYRLTTDESLRIRLAEAGPERASQFSWKKTAEATLQALRDAASQRRRLSG